MTFARRVSPPLPSFDPYATSTFISTQSRPPLRAFCSLIHVTSTPDKQPNGLSFRVGSPPCCVLPVQGFSVILVGCEKNKDAKPFRVHCSGFSGGPGPAFQIEVRSVSKSFTQSQSEQNRSLFQGLVPPERKLIALEAPSVDETCSKSSLVN